MSIWRCPGTGTKTCWRLMALMLPSRLHMGVDYAATRVVMSVGWWASLSTEGRRALWSQGAIEACVRAGLWTRPGGWWLWMWMLQVLTMSKPLALVRRLCAVESTFPLLGSRQNPNPKSSAWG